MIHSQLSNNRSFEHCSTVFPPTEDTASCCCTGATACGATACGAAGVSTAACACGGASERFNVPFLASCPRRKDIVSMEKWGKDGQRWYRFNMDDPNNYHILNRCSSASRSNANVSAPLPLIIFDNVSNLGGLRSLQQGQKQRPVASGKKMQKRDPMPMCPNSVPTGRRRAVWTGSLRGTSGALPG